MHDRVPLILAESDWPKWLGEEPATEEELVAILKPCADEVLKVWPVDKQVGNVKNNGAELLTPVEVAVADPPLLVSAGYHGEEISRYFFGRGAGGARLKPIKSDE